MINVVLEVKQATWASMTADPLDIDSQFRVKRANIRYDTAPYDKYIKNIGLQISGTEMISWALQQVIICETIKIFPSSVRNIQD